MIPKHARAGLQSAQECAERPQNARQDGNCSACNRPHPRRLRRRRRLHLRILDRRDLLHLTHRLWRSEMHRDSYSHTIGNSCSLRVFSSMECQRGRKILAHYSPRAPVNFSNTLLFLFLFALYTLRCWKPAEFDWNMVQWTISADLGTLYHYLGAISVGTLDTIYWAFLYTSVGTWLDQCQHFIPITIFATAAI